MRFNLLKKRFKKKEKILLYGSNWWYFGAGMLGPLFAVFAERIGGDILDIAWVWAVYLVVSGTLIVFIGKISDKKISKEKLMIGGFALNTIFTFAYVLVSSQLGLFIVQAGLGVAHALATPTWSALYAKYEDKRHAHCPFCYYGYYSVLSNSVSSPNT